MNKKLIHIKIKSTLLSQLLKNKTACILWKNIVLDVLWHCVTVRMNMAHKTFTISLKRYIQFRRERISS